MKRTALFILLISTFAHAQKHAPKVWTVEDIFRNGGPTGTPPGNIEWSPDGKLLTFLAPDDSVGKAGDLLALDTATNKISVLATQDKLTSAAISEKDKDHRARYGMPSYTWAADSKHLILDSGGVISLYDVASQTATRIVDTGNGSGDDPKFSPDARSISYLRDHNLFVAPAEPNSHNERNLSNTQGDTLLNGEVDWVYLEELDVRSNYFWSPDSQRIAYLQADESKVPEYPLPDLSGTHATVDMQRYPQPGDPNPSVRVGVVSAKGGKTKWIDIPQSAGNDYIPRLGWVTAQTLYVEVLTRDQKHLNLYLADASTGKAHLIYDDYDSKYLDTNYDVTFIDATRFIVKSWRSGHTHLYLYSIDAKHPLDGVATLVTPLTKGDFEVEDLLSVDIKSNTVYYTSNEGNPLGNSLSVVQLDGTRKQDLIQPYPPPAVNEVQDKRIKTLERKSFPCCSELVGDMTEEFGEKIICCSGSIKDLPPGITNPTRGGTHYISLSPDYQHFVDMQGDMLWPYNVKLCESSTNRCSSIWESQDLNDLFYRINDPDEFAIKTKDGTTLYVSLTLPTNKIISESVPLILNPYGGPHDQDVKDAWGGPLGLFDQLLAQHGFAVLHVDNRGMGGRGRDFEQAAYNNFGPVQLDDQLTALDQVLSHYPQLDPQRLGFWGWSWGGTFTLYAMEHSDRFKAGVAVAPVTDWRLYDSIYTERYLGLPGPNANDNAKVYDADSTIKFAAQLHGKLLLVHGTGDDNVHLANSLQQQQAFIDAQVPFDLELFPGKTHSISGYTDRVNLFNHILNYFEANLK